MSTWRPGGGAQADPITCAIQNATQAAAATFGQICFGDELFAGSIYSERRVSLDDELGGGGTYVNVTILRARCCDVPKALRCHSRIKFCGKEYQVVEEEGSDRLGFCSYVVLSCHC